MQSTWHTGVTNGRLVFSGASSISDFTEKWLSEKIKYFPSSKLKSLNEIVLDRISFYPDTNYLPMTLLVVDIDI